MIATARGLAVVTALAVVLAIVLAVDLARTVPPADRALVPAFDATGVTALAWPEHRVRITRDARSSTGWAWEAPPGEADARTVEGVLAALRGARWHRRADAATAGATTATLHVEGPAARTIAIGQPLGADQHWVVIDGDARLVERWVVRALVPEPLALRVRAPLARALEVTTLAVRPGVTLRGFPRRLVELRGQPVDLLAHPGLVAELERALAELALIGVPDAPIAAPPTATTIALDGIDALADAGQPCDRVGGSRAVVGPRVGAGCVAEAAWQDVERAAAAFDPASPATLVDPRPAPVEPIRIRLPDGVDLDLARRPRLPDRDADPARVAELLVALASPAEPAARPAGATPTARLEVEAASGTIMLELLPGGLVARRGEPAALRVGDAAFAVLARPSAAYGDPRIWTEEPTTIRSVAIGPRTFTRGAVLGEWTGPGTVDAAAVDDLVARLAALEGRGPAPSAPGGRTVTLEVAPPMGAPVRRTLVLGRTRAGCAVTADGQRVLVDAVLCDRVDQLAR